MPPDDKSRIESAIERLTDISSDLKSMLAVHEQRISSQEKLSDGMLITIEKRREEMEDKVNEIYEHMSKRDVSILNNIDTLRKELLAQHTSLAAKVSLLEKYIWMAVGGGSVLSFVLSLAVKLLFG